MSHNNIESRIKRVQKQLNESYDLLKHHKERNVSSTVGEPSNIPESPVANTVTNVCSTGVVGATFVDDVFDQIKNCIIELDEEAGPDLVFDINGKWHRPTRNILKDIPLGKHYRVYKPTKITEGFAEPPHGPKTKEFRGPPAARFELDPKPENPFIEIRMVSEPRGQDKKNTLIFSRAILPDTPAIGGERGFYQTVYSFGIKFSDTPFDSEPNSDPIKHNDPGAKAIAQAEELAAARAAAAEANAKAVAQANAARLAAPASGNNSSSKKNGNTSVVAAPASGNNSAAAGNASVVAVAAPASGNNSSAANSLPANSPPALSISSTASNNSASSSPADTNSPGGFPPAPASGPINRRAQQNRWIRFAEGTQTQANLNASPGYVKSQAAKINSNVAAAAAAQKVQNNLFAARSASAAKASKPMAFAKESGAPGINRVANSMRRNAERIRAARGKPQATGWWAPSKGRGGTRKLRRANKTRKIKQSKRRQ